MKINETEKINPEWKKFSDCSAPEYDGAQLLCRKLFEFDQSFEYTLISRDKNGWCCDNEFIGVELALGDWARFNDDEWICLTDIINI